MNGEKGSIMKKIVFGISLILFGIALFLLDEIGHFSFLRNDFAQLIYVILPFAGLGMSVFGFLEKEKSK